MNALEIIKSLKDLGVTLEVHSGQLKVTASKNRLTPEQVKLITENKLELHKILSLLKNAPRPKSLQVAQQYGDPPTSKDTSNQSPYFFEGLQPNGKMLRLTKEEFNEFVDFFRILIKMDRQQKKFLSNANEGQK